MTARARIVGWSAPLAVCLLLGAGALFPLTTAASSCVAPQQRVIERGSGSRGMQWSVTASIKPNPGCRTWLLGFEFRPAGTRSGSWSGRWAVPAHGHLPRGFGISARDEWFKSMHAVSGVVGREVSTLSIATNTGAKVVVRPSVPSKSLRRRFVWLRGVKYFLYYYDAGEHVRAITLQDRAGEAIAKVSGQEGEFQRLGIVGGH